MKRSIFAVSCLLLLVATAPAVPDALAAFYPSQPVKVIVPFSQGGSTSVTARFFQKAVQDEKILNGMPMPIMYMPGAGGTLGARQVKDAKPDGYTILLWHIGVCGAEAMKNVDFSYRDFAAVAATGSQGYYITVNEESPYKTIKDLIDKARNAPNTVSAAVNLGAASHLGMVMLEQAVPGLRFRFVQAGGTSENYTSLVGGHVEVALLPVPSLKQLASKGVRPLAIMSAKRDPAFPDVPTMAEAGYNAEFTMTNWWFAPKDMPEKDVRLLAEAFKKAMDTPYIKSSFEKSSIDLDFLSGEELEKSIARQCGNIVSMQERVRGEK